MKMSKTFTLMVVALIVAALSPAAVFAEQRSSIIPDRPTHVDPYEINLVEAATPVKEQMHAFHDMMMVVITAITLFVLALLIIVVVRYNKRANPKPSTTTHNVTIEVVWTALPVAILVAIAVPSFNLLYFLDRSPDQTEARAARAAGEDVTVYDEMTLKIVGYQWYWGYEYPDHGIDEYMSYMLEDDQLTPERPYRLLEVDNRVVVPVDTNIRLLITAADVIHAWAVPAFGVKKDAIPGRLNETWMRIEKPGVYYGQCSELCGVKHGFMPIAVEAVSKAQFNAWVERVKRDGIENATVPSEQEARVLLSSN